MPIGSLSVETEVRPDVEMREDSEGDDEEPATASEGRTAPGRKSKKERDEELRDMMEGDDEDEPMTNVVEEESEDEGEDEDPESEPLAAEEPGEKKPRPEPTPVVSGGRRRGRRRVMKKRTMKDEEGYLGRFR